MKEADFYIKLKEGAVQCRLCNHFCAIARNETGECGIRKNISGQLYSLVYGLPAAANVDPIEKKPLFHFLPGSLAYSIGTLGCNFHCGNCQNWQISQTEQSDSTLKSTAYLEPEKIIGSASYYHCRSIAYTYNEPTIFTEYALAIMRLAKAKGFKNVWVSNGYMSEQCLRAILPYLDAINVDLKSMDENFYQDNCQARLTPVLDNLRRIKNQGIHLEITTLVIPSLSDDITMLSRIADFISSELDNETPWHLSKFYQDISWKLKNYEDTPAGVISEAYQRAKEAGLKYVYAGNLPGDAKENTYCPKCGELAVSRFAYEVERLDNHGRCRACDMDLNILDG